MKERNMVILVNPFKFILDLLALGNGNVLLCDLE